MRGTLKAQNFKPVIISISNLLVKFVDSSKDHRVAVQLRKRVRVDSSKDHPVAVQLRRAVRLYLGKASFL